MKDSKLCMGCMNEKPSDGACPNCGFNEKSEPNGAEFLKLRSVLADRYVVGRVLESNGEGVTYMGFDRNTDTPVRIREFAPSNLCRRAENGALAVIPGEDDTFSIGLASFRELSKRLSNLNDLPALVPVTDIFSENGTAYRITENYVGITLREFLMRNNGTLNWEQVKPLFLPIISTVKALHSAGIIHMGISPETLIVCRDGKLRLTGFCIKDARTSHNSIAGQLYPGFAAIEQYGVQGSQGPWTDVYGFAATIYRTLVGNPPMEATERVTSDHMTIPAKIAQTLPSHVMTALANALQILPEDRIRTMTQFREELLATEGASSHIAAVREGKKSGKQKTKSGGSGKYIIIASAVTAAVLFLLFMVIYIAFLRPDNTPSDEPLNSGIAPPSMEATSTVSYADPTKYYEVPDLAHETYATAIEKYGDTFKIEIVSLGYNDGGFKRGEIYDQFPAKGEKLVKESTIQIRISNGPSTVSIGNVIGRTYEEAYVILLEKGFHPENISTIEKFEPNKTPGTVVGTDPENAGKISPESKIILYINPQISEPEETDQEVY